MYGLNFFLTVQYTKSFKSKKKYKSYAIYELFKSVAVVGELKKHSITDIEKESSKETAKRHTLNYILN